MTEYQYMVMLLLIIIPVILFCFYKNKEQRLYKEYEIAAARVKEEHNFLEEKKRKSKSGVTVTLEHIGNNNYILTLHNSGGIILRNVEMKLLLEEYEDNPLNFKEYDRKFPIDKLLVGKNVTLNLIQYAGSPLIYNIRIVWTEPNGVRVEDQVYVGV